MPRFRYYNYDQDAMVVINYQEQLQPGTFEHAVHYLIEHKLDLSLFHPKYRNDDNGRLAYDPAILLKIILFAYSKGITSSREMQWCCETNIIFKALSCDTVPHFTTLAKFVSSHADEIEELFEQVLLVCHEQGLLGNELFAIDGCKMSSNAAKEWSGNFRELGEKRDKLRRLIRHHLKEHYEKDEAETEAELDRDIRRAKTILSLDESLQKVDRFLKTNRPRMGRGKRSKEVKSNITDNESAKMTTSKGTIQGYNGVATVDRKHQVIICWFFYSLVRFKNQESTLPIEPSDFAHNEAWLLFQLNEAPVMTEADGNFNAMAIMEVATGMIFGMELVQVSLPGLPEFLSRKLLADAEGQSGSRPQKLFIASEYDADDLVKVAKSMGIEVERVPAIDLSGITQEAREGFAAHVSGGRAQ